MAVYEEDEHGPLPGYDEGPEMPESSGCSECGGDYCGSYSECRQHYQVMPPLGLTGKLVEAAERLYDENEELKQKVRRLEYEIVMGKIDVNL